MKTTIVIPAYNEEARIQATAEDYIRYIQSSMNPAETELYIVVNGSVDRTEAIAHAIADQHDFVRCWSSPERMGKGGAVLKGFELGSGDILAFTDADNSTTPPFLHALVREVEQGADCAIGSRWLPESRQLIQQPFTRRLASRVFNLIVRCLFQLPYRDTQCGAKAFRKPAFEAIRSDLHTTGWAFDVAMIWQLRKRGYAVHEVPIDWSDNSKSRVRLHSDGPSMLWELIRMRLQG